MGEAVVGFQHQILVLTIWIACINIIKVADWTAKKRQQKWTWNAYVLSNQLSDISIETTTVVKLEADAFKSVSDCHHDEPKTLSYFMRPICVLIADIKNGWLFWLLIWAHGIRRGCSCKCLTTTQKSRPDRQRVKTWPNRFGFPKTVLMKDSLPSCDQTSTDKGPEEAACSTPAAAPCASCGAYADMNAST